MWAHARLLCPPLPPRVCTNLCTVSRWCHRTISSSVTPFSSCLQSSPASGSFLMSWPFASGGQNTRASVTVLPMNIHSWFSLGLTGLISLQSKGLSRVFCSTTIQKHQFFSAQPTSQQYAECLLYRWVSKVGDFWPLGSCSKKTFNESMGYFSIQVQIAVSSIYQYYEFYTLRVYVYMCVRVCVCVYSPHVCCSVAELCLTLCDSMDCSTSGFPVLRYLPEFAQTHVHWISDAIQPSHPLSYSSLSAFNLSQHQGLFQWVSSLHQVAKVLEFQLQHQSFQWIFRTDFL